MNNQVLPMHFDKVARFAALELMLRGPGVKKEYDYNLVDVITVAFIYDHTPNPTDDSFRNVTKRRKQILNLHNAFKRHMQKWGTKSTTRGQTNKDAQ